MPKRASKQSVGERLAAIEAELISLRAGEKSDAQIKFEQSEQKPVTVLRVHFGRVALERKPYAVTFGGGTITLTPIRAAIVLVLLMDLIERSETGRSSGNNLPRVKTALSRLSPEDSSATSDDAVRVALYRAGQFIEEEFSTAHDDDLSFSVERGLLLVRANGILVDPSRIEVELTTSDQAISSFLDQTLATSPLARLRKSKALYVPGGNDGQDRLLYELLDHSFPTKQTCLFYRPTIQSFPQQLLAKMKVSPRRRERQEIVTKSYQRGSLNYCEILPKKCLWELIERTPGKGYQYYPPGFTTADVIQHLDHLQFLVRSEPAYELVLTDAFLPFYLTTFEISRPDAIERFILFFQHQEEQNIKQVSVFALKDDSVFFSTHDRIIKWVLAHPTTTRNKEHVLDEIEAVRTFLIETSESYSKPFISRPTSTDELPLSEKLEVHNVRKAAKASPKKKEKIGYDNPTNRQQSSK